MPPPLGGHSSASGICHLFSALGASLLPFFTMTTEKKEKKTLREMHVEGCERETGKERGGREGVGEEKGR